MRDDDQRTPLVRSPSLWTHPLVCLPVCLSSLFVCGLSVRATGTAGLVGEVIAWTALASSLVGCCLLGCLWLLGTPCCRDEGPKVLAGERRPEPFHADVLQVPGGGELAMSYAPGRKRGQDQRNLQDDVAAIRRKYKIDAIVTLLEERELQVMQCERMCETIEAEGMVWIYFSVRDKWVPGPLSTDSFLQQLVLPVARRLQAGQRVLVHCNGGKGRTGTLAAALLLTSMGGGSPCMTLAEAVRALRGVRPGMLRNPLQQLFLLHIRASLRMSVADDDYMFWILKDIRVGSGVPGSVAASEVASEVARALPASDVARASEAQRLDLLRLYSEELIALLNLLGCAATDVIGLGTDVAQILDVNELRLDQITDSEWDFRIFHWDATWGPTWGKFFAGAMGQVIGDMAECPTELLVPVPKPSWRTRGEAQPTISYGDFVNKELVYFAKYDVERMIPSLVDGLKPGQRKVLFGAFLKRLTGETKVAQLSGYVAEKSAYHHGETSLQGTIIGMAQTFVGTNNINLFAPCGQFGTRNQGGKDHAAARYIFTKLMPAARCVFPEEDDPVLESQTEEGQNIEPRWYCPVIPLVLVNGAEGIGVGWSTSVPNYNPRDIIANVRSHLAGDALRPMTPWYCGFKGTITPSPGEKAGRYDVMGVVTKRGISRVEITELPVRRWTQAGAMGYGYLLKMKLWNLTEERLAELERQLEKKRAELAQLRATTLGQLWEHDLLRVEKALDTQDAEEVKDARESDKLSKKAGFKEDDGLVNRQCVLVLSQSFSLIKRVRTEQWKARARGGRGQLIVRAPKKDASAGVEEEDAHEDEGPPDAISGAFACREFDALLAFTENGYVYALQALDVPLGKKMAPGVPIGDLVPGLGAGHRITAVITVPQGALKDQGDEFAVIVTANGLGKKIPLSAFRSIKPGKSSCAFTLDDGDEVRWVHRAAAKDLLVCASESGFVLCFQLTPGLSKTSLKARGKPVMRLNQE
ncbi:unnamed protein product, partial [Polarella glacialis]